MTSKARNPLAGPWERAGDGAKGGPDALASTPDLSSALRELLYVCEWMGAERFPRFVLASSLYESTTEFSRGIRDSGASRVWGPRDLVPLMFPDLERSPHSQILGSIREIVLVCLVSGIQGNPGSESPSRAKRLIVHRNYRFPFAGVSFLLTRNFNRGDLRRERDFWQAINDRRCGLSEIRPDTGCKMRWSISDWCVLSRNNTRKSITRRDR